MNSSIEATIRLSLTGSLAVLSATAGIQRLIGFSAADFTSGKVGFQQLIHAHDQDIADSLFSSDMTVPDGIINIRLRQASRKICCVKGTFRKLKEEADNGIVLELLLQDAKSLWQGESDTPMMSNFAAIMENTDDYIYFKDRNHVFTGASQTLVAITSPSEHWTDLLGQTDYDVFPEEYADIYYELEKQVFAGTAVAHEVQQFVDNQGEQGWVDNRKYPLHGDNGDIIGLFGVARDVTEIYRQQQKVEQLLGEQAAILNNRLVGIVTVRDRQIVWANAAFKIMLGYDEDEIVGYSTQKFYRSEDDYKAIGEAYVNIGKGVVRNELEFVRKDGQLVWVDMRGSVLHEETGDSIWVFIDVTERKKAEIALALSEAKFRTLFDSTNDAVILHDQNRIIDANSAALKLFACATVDEFCSRRLADLSPHQQPDGRNSEKLFRQRVKTSIQHGISQFEWLHKRLNSDETFHADVLISVINLNGNIVVQATVRDITLRKDAEVKMEQMAYYDQLTNLPNRRLLLECLKQSMTSSARSGRGGALLFLDLDQFKHLNDTHGHDIGDLLLQRVGERLTACVREVDTVARFGGDEFVVLLDALSADLSEISAQAETMGNKILTALQHPYLLATSEYSSGASIGATLFIGHQSGVNELLKQADLALYQAKHRGGNVLCFFDPQML